MQLNLTDKVRAKIESIGQAKAAEFFGVSEGTIALWSRGKRPSLEAAQLVLNEYYTDTEKLDDAVKGNVPDAELWPGRNVIFLLPCYKGLSPETQESLYYQYSKYGASKIGILMHSRTLIVEARNVLAQKFLRTTAEWAIFIDDDIILPPGSADVFNTRWNAQLPKPYADYLFIDQIMSSNTLLVGALYFGRHPAGKGQYSGAFESPIENANAHKMVNAGLKPCSWVATGAMKIHRSVFEKIMSVAPEKFPDIIPTKEGRAWGFFNTMGQGMGEDVSFCVRAGQAGIQPYVDTSLVCLHQGNFNYGPATTTY